MKLFSKNKENDNLIIEQPQENIYTKGVNTPTPSHRLTADEVLGLGNNNSSYDGKSALDSLRKRMQEMSEQKPQKPSTEVPKPTSITPETPVVSEPKADPKTLLEKCRPYITDDKGRDASIPSAPLYKLESVAEILKSDSQKTIDALAKKYDITVDDLGKNAKIEKSEPQKTAPQPPTEPPKKEEIKIEAIFKNVQSSVPLAVSEIDNNIPEEKYESSDFSNTATITFTPVNDSKSDKPKIFVSSNTQGIDLTGEIAPIENQAQIFKTEQVTLEKDEFEDFVPQNEIKSETDAKKYIRKFSLSKRRSFLSVSFSVILTLAIAFMKLPFMSGLILGQTKTVMIIMTAISGIVVLLNCDMFCSLSKIFRKSGSPDICMSFASLFTLAYAILGVISGEIVIDMLLLLCILLSIRALSKFRKDSYMLSNLKQITTSAPKAAIKLINDTAVTFAMAKNSIEGDTLIAAPQKCNKISDFIKYATFGTFLGGKLPIITVLSLVFSLFTGLAAASYYGAALHGLYAAAVVNCFSALPCLFFIKDFPLYAAAKKLNKTGGMIAGQAAASHLEAANALVLNSSDIFPSGTVTLHQMKVLSENNLDETILRAASLTECLNSPLAPIFKRIAGESNITALPDSDTIKYEERMGISGWVNDKLLFIGNRTLMEAHGIKVPDIEVDRKILRNGYFPIYVASADKVCALLVVQYSVDPDVAYHLRRLTKIGVTVLINNTDPNITNEMICDYLGLYDDSVMIMSNAGYHMYKNATEPKETCSAPACFRGSPIAIAKIMNYANKIKRSNNLLTILYIISAILGIVIFAYSSFAGSGTIIGSTTVLLYSLICTAVSYLLYLTQKP
ncbi:MAG: cation-translocating P-type ATPase [Clostridia bacterium]|nr:cation-translocating P-type ATPase [Clostridia bacterium]